MIEKLFCLKCGSPVKPEYWREQVFYRCLGNPEHFIRKDIYEAAREEIDMTLNMEKEE